MNNLQYLIQIMHYNGWYKVYPVHNGKNSWGVFDCGGDYLYQVFDTREEAEKWAERKNEEIKNNE